MAHIHQWVGSWTVGKTIYRDCVCGAIKDHRAKSDRKYYERMAARLLGKS